MAESEVDVDEEDGETKVEARGPSRRSEGDTQAVFTVSRLALRYA